jgi:pimeloyl-ACP methyl ester carboxylesterase
MPTKESPRPFRINVSDEILDDLKQRISMARWPDEIPEAPWRYGTSLAYMKELSRYWRHEYDWRIHEKRLNSFDQYKVRIGDIDLHYIHAKGVGPNPMPLIISHGWPGSVYEFVKIIDPLTNPAAYGGNPEDAFTVVAPSLPGFGFSSLSGKRRYSLEMISDLFFTLMTDVLGFPSFAAQGGDWGSMITSRLAYDHPDKVLGIHLNFMSLMLSLDKNIKLTPPETDFLRQLRSMDDELGYQWIQGTKPQTLAYGLNDSPVGLAAWIIEKFHSLTDCRGQIENSLGKDDLLSNIMIYWVTKTINSSSWLYYWIRHTPWRLMPGEKINVPTGFAAFPVEFFKSPKEWVERAYNLIQFTTMDSGGHFAAMEKPDKLVEDIRTFFRKLR